MERLELDIIPETNGGLMMAILAYPDILDEIKAEQFNDFYLCKMRDEIPLGKRPGFVLGQGVLMFANRLCVPNVKDLKGRILEEAHSTKYSVHPRSNKMYQNLRENFWWRGMKCEVAKYVSECSACQQVKAERQVPAGLLQPLPIAE